MIRSGLSSLAGCALALMALPAFAAERAATWIVPQPDPAATAEPVQAPVQGLFYAQPAAYEGAAELRQAYRAEDAEIAAGTPLFMTEVGRGPRLYCASQALRQLNAGDVIGVGVRNSLLGAVVGASRLPKALAWQCFQDADGDMVFERAGGGEPAPQTAAPMVARVSQMQDLQTPLPYAAAPSPPMRVGLMARPMGSWKTGSWEIWLCHEGGGEAPITTCYLRPRWVFNGEPLTIEALGGAVTITAVSGEKGAEQVTYQAGAPFTQRFTTVSQARTTGGAVSFGALLATPRK